MRTTLTTLYHLGKQIEDAITPEAFEQLRQYTVWLSTGLSGMTAQQRNAAKHLITMFETLEHAQVTEDWRINN